MALQALLWTRFDEVLRVWLLPRERDGYPCCNPREDLQGLLRAGEGAEGPLQQKFFQNGDFRMDDYFNVAIMNLVLHYFVGSLDRPGGARTRTRKQAHPRIVHRW